MTVYDDAARRLQAALDAPPSSRLRVDLNDVRTLLAEHFENAQAEEARCRTHHPDRSTRTEEAMSETEPRCSTPCDDDCEAVCHEDHVPGHKKAHWPYDCPATERYGWGGSDFIAAAVKRLREERDCIKAELDARIAAESADAAAGSYAGRAEEAEAARDAVQAEATLLRRALIGRRTFPVGVMRTPMDERTEAIRARWDEFCFSGPSETDRERDQVIGWLLDRMDSATARAEKAEAELKRLAKVATRSVADLNPDDEWDEIKQLTELLAAATNRAEKVEAALAEMRRARATDAQMIAVVLDAYTEDKAEAEYQAIIALQRRYDSITRTALERAADEQGDGEGGDDA